MQKDCICGFHTSLEKLFLKRKLENGKKENINLNRMGCGEHFTVVFNKLMKSDFLIRFSFMFAFYHIVLRNEKSKKSFSFLLFFSISFIRGYIMAVLAFTQRSHED